MARLCRWQIEEGQAIAGLIMAAGFLELRFPLCIDQGRCDIGERIRRIASCRMPLRLDEDRPSRSETTECTVQPAPYGNKFGAARRYRDRSPEPHRPLKRAILVQDNPLEAPV